jgi:hypothetical protein
MKITGTITIENGVIEIKLPLPESVSNLLKTEVEEVVAPTENILKQGGVWRTIRVINSTYCTSTCAGETWSDRCAIFVSGYRLAHNIYRERCSACIAAIRFVTEAQAEDINGIEVFVRGET